MPFGFFGTVLNTDVSAPGAVSDAALEEQTALMARSGVESLRLTFPWASLEPARGVFDFRSTDRLVAAAARHRISVLANVLRHAAMGVRPSQLAEVRPTTSRATRRSSPSS